MRKLAIIRKEKESQWKSCQSITHNLFLSYESIADQETQVLSYYYSRDAGAFEAYLMAQELFEASVSHIIFIDHEPHPCELINALAFKFKTIEKKPEIIFHLFGDFILQSVAWQKCSKALMEFSVKLICASDKQKELIDKLLVKGTQSLIIPFPLNSTNKSFNAEDRKRAKSELGLGEAFTFVYTGRLSYQKNVIDLIHAFAKVKEAITSPVRLIFAGPMDDLGAPYLGKEGIAGTFFYHWEEALREYPELTQTNELEYLGNLDSTRLRHLYLAGDAYLSMSAHNDEDYGMSPAEALGLGLPCLLSSWGGFISFKKKFKEQVTLCPLVLGSRRHKCTKASIFKSMMLLLNNKKSDEERFSSGLAVTSILGHKAIGLRLRTEVLNSSANPFKGFNDRFVKLASVFETSPSAPFRGADGGFSEFYRSLYEDYAKVDS